MMRAPALSELPPPPPGKTGWPWTIGALAQGPLDSAKKEWVSVPRISIVTPSFNQGEFLEETIRSVLLQNYPNLEYIIIDGGSSDHSIEIIKRYERWLAFWVSEKDNGQSNAINKGWARATAEILAWLNSDDWYQPSALWTVAGHFLANPDCSWLVGAVDNSFAPDRVVRRFSPRPTSLVKCLGRKDYGFHQPGIFWRRGLVATVGPLDEDLHCSFDHDFWIRSLLQKFDPAFTQNCFAGFRWHKDSKSCSRRQVFLREDWQVFRRYQKCLDRKEATEARRWLLEYEAETTLVSTYQHLAEHRRWNAFRSLLSVLRLFPHLRPRRLGFGALYRTLVTGQSPAWFKH